MGTIAAKLAYLNDTKLAIKNAIIAKGVSIIDGTAFREYATKIASIVAPVTFPTFSTTAPSSITSSTMIANGNITDFGGFSSEVCSVRFSYGTDTAATNIGTTSWVAKSTTGDFSANLTGLSGGTVYYVKAQMQDANRLYLGAVDASNIVSATTLSEVLDADTYVYLQSTGGTGYSALDATNVPTLVNGTLTSNEVVLTGTGSATTKVYAQDVGQGDFTAVQPSFKARPYKFTIDGTSTASSLVLVSPISGLLTNGSKLIVDDGSVKEVMASSVVETTDGNVFAGYPCEFSHFNSYYSQNITKETSLTNLNAWSLGTSLPVAMWYSACIVTSNRIYICGGVIGSGVYTAQIDNDGIIGAWVAAPSLPVGISNRMPIITNTRVYLVGSASGGYNGNVYYAPINSDGTLGAWVLGTAFPISIGYMQAVITKDRAYVFGGRNSGGYLNTIYYAAINSDGSLGTWTSAGTLPATLGEGCAFTTKSRVYIVSASINGGFSSSTYYAPINSDGSLGSWATGTGLPAAVNSGTAIVLKNKVFLIGLVNTSGYAQATTYTASIDTDGVVGNWSSGTSLNTAVSVGTVAVTKSRIYFLGGSTGSSGTAAVQYTSFTEGWVGVNNNTTLINPKYTCTSLSPSLSATPTLAYNDVIESQILHSSDNTNWTTVSPAISSITRSTDTITKNYIKTTISGRYVKQKVNGAVGDIISTIGNTQLWRG